MKLFSNFDTNLRETKFQEYQEQFGAENVMVFGRSILYFVVKVFLPTLFIATVTALCLWLLYSRLGSEYMHYFTIIIILLDLVRIVPIIGKYIDYKMDFIIVTPDVLIMYDQGGLFRRNVISTNEKSIKTISVKKNGILYSIFDNGDILFLTEGDSDEGEIILRWVPKPEKRRKEIAKIMSKDYEPKILETQNTAV